MARIAAVYKNAREEKAKEEKGDVTKDQKPKANSTPKRTRETAPKARSTKRQKK